MFQKIVKIVSSAVIIGSLFLSNCTVYAKETMQQTVENSEGDCKEENQQGNQSITQQIDQFFQGQMEEYDIPGAAVIVVKDGKVAYSQSYGLAAIENKEAFMEDTTFRIASITKVFTATALMQLVEEGKVSLQEDITTYLPTLQLKNPYNQPITVENLLTHTSGIDSSCLGDLSHTEEDMPSGYLLDQMNQKHLQVVTKPGSRIEYCSYGVVLQGCIIEAVTDESCKEYIQNHILIPLDMKDTNMSMYDNKLSNGYVKWGDSLSERTLDGYFRLYPEGGLISSLQDMGHFMQMCLQGGTFEKNQILSKKSVQDMLSRRAYFDEALPGVGLGFAEYREQGLQLFGHGGYASDGFLTQMDLYPEENTGTFVIVNQGSNSNIMDDFRKTFVNMMSFETGCKEDEKNTKTQQDNQINVTGIYRFSDYSKTTLCKGNAFGGVGEVHVKEGNEHQIIIKGMDEFTKQKFELHAEWQDDLHYKLVESEDYIVFKTNHGKVTNMAMTKDSWHGYYDKIGLLESGGVQVPFVMFTILMDIVFLFAIMIAFVVRKCKKQKISKMQVNKYVTMSMIAFSYSGFLLYSLFLWGDRLRYEIPFDVKVNQCMPILGTICLLVFTYLVIKEWKNPEHKIISCLFDTFFLCISLLYCLLLYYWNLLGFWF